MLAKEIIIPRCVEKSNDKYSLVTSNENFVLLQTDVGFTADVKEGKKVKNQNCVRLMFTTNVYHGESC